MSCRLAPLAVIVGLAVLGCPRGTGRSDPGRERYEPCEASAREIEAYMQWVSMLTRRAGTAARGHWERSCAGTAREELRKACRWLQEGRAQERRRDERLPHRRPVSVARRIDEPVETKSPRHTWAYRKALRGLHIAERSALAVLGAAGLDPEREWLEESADPDGANHHLDQAPAPQTPVAGKRPAAGSPGPGAAASPQARARLEPLRSPRDPARVTLDPR